MNNMNPTRKYLSKPRFNYVDMFGIAYGSLWASQEQWLIAITSVLLITLISVLWFTDPAHESP